LRGDSANPKRQALLEKEVSQILRQAQAFHFVEGRGLSKKRMGSGAAHGTPIIKVPSDGNYRG
jgi:hypothetical protein